MKLKHFSSFIMLVALLCLFAYLAGRVDVSAATSVSSGEHAAQSASKGTVDTKEASMFLGLRTVKYDVQDVAKAKEWYGKVFGVQPYFDEPAYYVGYNIGGYELGLTPAAAPAQGPRG